MAENFLNKILSCLSHKVCSLSSSTILLCKFSVIKIED